MPEVSAGEYLVEAAGTPALVAALTAWLAEQDQPLADLRAGRQRLEDVFLRLVADPVAPAPGASASSLPGAGLTILPLSSWLR